METAESHCHECDLARNGCSRRDFLHRAAGTAALVSLPLLTPGQALAKGPANAIRNIAGFAAASFVGGAAAESSGLVPLGFTANFFGTGFRNVAVNLPGNVTFDGGHPSLNMNTVDLTNTNAVVIAGFLANVDDRNSSKPTYGQGVLCGRRAFGANYIDVANFNNGAARNSFQIILIEWADIRSGDFDIELNYNSIGWDVSTTGANPARIGYANNSKAGGAFGQFPGSNVQGTFLDNGTAPLVASSRVASTLGRYHLFVRNGQVIIPPPGAVANVDVTSKVRIFDPLRWIFHSGTRQFSGDLTVQRRPVQQAAPPTAECLDEQVAVPVNANLGPPITLVFPILPQGVTIANPSGTTRSGQRYISMPGVALAPGGVARALLSVRNPQRANLGTYFNNLPVRVFAGAFDPLQA